MEELLAKMDHLQLDQAPPQNLKHHVYYQDAIAPLTAMK
jgi:hypothetical protein